nr:DegV family protein [uncultured Oscillibacter sp.]
MRTAVVTDSNSGIFEAEAQRLGIYVLPMPVMIEGREYFEGVDLFHNDFYQSLLEHKRVSTSQPTPGNILTLWDKVLSDGYDELVYIPMSSGLSNSCQTALMLAGDYEGKIHVVDNHRISVTQRSSVLDALTLAQAGYTASEIKTRLEQTAYDSIIYVGVETLEFLRRGGRVTAAGAAMSTVLNIKPLLTIQGERLDAYAKVRGTKNCKKREIEAMRKSAEEFHRKGQEIRVGAAGSFLHEEEDREWLEMVKTAFPGEEVYYDRLTFSIGCHVGPGAFGMGISVKL